MRAILLALPLGLTLATAAGAETFQRIDDRNGFLSLVKDRTLKRLGVRLEVTGDGRIIGSAFGRAVTGAWRWENGYFCRDLYYGKEDLGPNCQLVQVRGQTMRFTADRGQGIHADLRLD